MRARGKDGRLDADKDLEGAMQRLAQSRRPGEPHRRGAQDRHQSADHRLAVAGDRRRDREEGHQRPARQAGDELYRIADHSHVWVIADVAEGDIAAIKVGTPRNRDVPRRSQRSRSRAR